MRKRTGVSWSHENFVIHEFEELESTNSYAFDLMSSGKICDREVILANSQSEGRGRQRRKWHSPNGNLYFSLLLQTPIPVEKISQISFVTIVALRSAMEKIFFPQRKEFSIKNKWPNDLIINDRKVAGILVESKVSQNISDFIVVGVGLNLESSPDDAMFPAGSLKDFEVTMSRQNIVRNFLDEFDKFYQNWLSFGFAGIRNSWLSGAYRLGQEITVNQANSMKGVFVGVDEAGNLLLERNGVVEVIISADVGCDGRYDDRHT